MHSVSNVLLVAEYIATAEHLGEALHSALERKFRDLRIVTITGRLGDEERHALVANIPLDKPHFLVTTDCLSEGVNLQNAFRAVVHYDLPWNPNRLEQREGRVDRYGQNNKVVRTIGLFSPDSPIDGVVLDVLLNKAKEIHRTLGTYVSVPEEGETARHRQRSRRRRTVARRWRRGSPSACDGQYARCVAQAGSAASCPG